MNGTDAIKYLAARLAERTDWAIDSIGGSGCDHDHDDELNALMDAVAEVRTFAAEFAGDPHHYSDGRLVKSSAQIDDGLYTSVVWHPIVERDEARSWRGALLSGAPGVPSPGLYEVETDPTTQMITVRVVRAV
ncbi:hypothetical protein [Tsukamurella hominis]|uniref:hypothetical protein n=1 Tax=Tsukamurella hominis TaxID=1970232 RepID=UPI0039E845FD